MEPPKVEDRAPKTCSFFASGTCRGGDECKFIHLTPPIPQTSYPNHFYFPPENTEQIIFTNSEGARVFGEYPLPERTIVVYHSAIQLPPEFDNPRIIWTTTKNPRHLFATLIIHATRLSMTVPNTVVFYFPAGTGKGLYAPDETLELACQLTQQGRICQLLPHVHMGCYLESLSPSGKPLESSFTDALSSLRQLLPIRKYSYPELLQEIVRLVGRRARYWTPELLAETLSRELEMTPEEPDSKDVPPLTLIDKFLLRIRAKQIPLSVVKQVLPGSEVSSFLNLGAVRKLLGVAYGSYREVPLLIRRGRSRVEQDRSEPWSTRNAHAFTQPAGLPAPGPPVKKEREK